MHVNGTALRQRRTSSQLYRRYSNTLDSSPDVQIPVQLE